MLKYIVILLLCASNSFAAFGMGWGMSEPAATSGTNFPSGWGYKMAITITNTLIDADLTDWTMVFDQSFDSVLTSANGPLDADGTKASLSGGGDIRFSSDSAGSTRLACDIRTWATDNTPTNATCEAAVLIPSVSSTGQTTIYMWWGNSSGTQPAVNETYGRHASYDSDSIGVWPLTENPAATAPQMSNRTSTNYAGTSSGVMTSGDSVAGVIGNALDFDGSDDYINCTDINEMDGQSKLTISVWMKRRAANSVVISSKAYNSSYDTAMHIWSDGKCYLEIGNGLNVYGFATCSGTVWHHMVLVFDGALVGNARLRGYADGAQLSLTYSSATPPATTASNANPFNIGSYIAGVAYYTAGYQDEMRVYQGVRSAAWIKADYNNQFNTSGFLTWGSISDL